MRIIYWCLALLATVALAGEFAQDEALIRHLKISGWGQDRIEYILRLPRHPHVDISGAVPAIHNGTTVTWIWDGAEYNYEVAAHFRVLKDGKIDGVYLYDHRLNGHEVDKEKVDAKLGHPK